GGWRPTAGAAWDGLAFDASRRSQALEVQPNRVRMHAETLGKLLGRQRARRPGELTEHRIARVVGEGLEHGQIHHRLTLASARAYFQGAACFYCAISPSAAACRGPGK